jgi:hypothetical protein
MKILIIEDDHRLVEAYQLILTHYVLIFSLDMKEIERLIPEVNLVLSDYQMGLPFKEIVMLTEKYAKPLLAVTACGDRVHPNQLDKPFLNKELIQKIESTVKG